MSQQLSKSVFLVGGTGFLGEHILTYLNDKDYFVEGMEHKVSMKLYEGNMKKVDEGLLDEGKDIDSFELKIDDSFIYFVLDDEYNIMFAGIKEDL